MKKNYESHLLENEVVLWEGNPEPFKLIEGVYKKSLITSWVIAALVVLAYITLYIPYAVRNDLMGNNVIVISVVVAACAACALFRPITEKSTLEKKTTYVFTNYRALVVAGSNVRSMFIDANTPFRIENMENGAGIIMMGTAVDSKLKSSRSNALTGILDMNDKTKMGGMIFYSVENAARVCECYAPFKK